jgi:hypothetical protein
MSGKAVRGSSWGSGSKKGSKERGEKKRDNNEDHDYAGQYDLDSQKSGNFAGEG